MLSSLAEMLHPQGEYLKLDWSQNKKNTFVFSEASVKLKHLYEYKQLVSQHPVEARLCGFTPTHKLNYIQHVSAECKSVFYMVTQQWWQQQPKQSQQLFL